MGALNTLPKIIVVGYPALHRFARSIFKEEEIFKGIDLETLPYNRFVENIAANKTRYKLESQDVLVAADRGALNLQENYNLPVIPVNFSGYELMEAVKKACKYMKDNNEIVLVIYYKKIMEIEELQSILNVKVKQIVFNKNQELDYVLQELKSAGHKLIIGGSNVCNLASKYGMKSIFMYTKLATKKALTNAANMLLAVHREAERKEQFITIINIVNSGIICTDNSWQITTFNNAAEKILNVKGNVLNRSIKEVFPLIDLPTSTNQVVAQKNKLVSIDQANVVMDVMPIIVNDTCTGVVFVIQDTLTLQKNEQEIRQKLHQRRLVANYTFANIIGESPVIKQTLSKARSFGQTESIILITGETGTGKELFAQSIHNISSRCNKPFVAINCAALPETLLDSELFGYEQGAFTGAHKEGKPGLFELAHTGTIFLDEIGEITPSMQARLLRVLQEKEVMRVGGVKIIPVNVRVIAATNQNLWDEVKAGNFREDLYYRLSVLELHTPSLRERIEDIPHLAKNFLRRTLTKIDDSLIEIIYLLSKDYTWPGNIRELENILERFVALAADKPNNEEILYNVFWEAVNKTDTHNNNGQSPMISVNELKNKMKKIESNEILQALEAVNGNKSAAARLLGISRSTLWRKINDESKTKRPNTKR
jgi:propionate catabolism operon transcriptional regulator